MVMYSDSEDGTTNYMDISDNFIWSDTTADAGWAEQHNRASVELEWHEATEENIAAYVK
jgi:hypothetical protein